MGSRQMASLEKIAATLRTMNDSMLIERWQRQLFSDDAAPIALEEFERRGIEVPETVVAAQDAKRRTTNYILLRTIRGLCGFMACLQVLALFPVIGWLLNLDATNSGMWIFALKKVLFLLLFGCMFILLRNFINKLHTKKYGKPHPSLWKQWSL